MGITNNNGLYWFENLDGKGTFSSIKNISTEDVSYINLVDIDNDDDLDLLYTTNTSVSKIVWRENLNGKGSFGASKTLSRNFNNYLQNKV